MFQRRRSLRVISVWVAIFQLLGLSPVVYANPRGGTVAAGGASILESGTTLSVRQQTDKAIVNWGSFSNAANETIQFQQPSSSSVILNRVTGSCGSNIDGALNSNGRVFLLNPNGVVFGKTATVNTGGLVASTLQMSDACFMGGKYNLKQDTGDPSARPPSRPKGTYESETKSNPAQRESEGIVVPLGAERAVHANVVGAGNLHARFERGSCWSSAPLWPERLAGSTNA